MSLLSHFGLWFAYLVSLFFLIFWFITFWEHREKFKKEEEVSPCLKRFPFVSVLVPAYNEGQHIESTLSSVLELNYPKDKCEIIVINDGSNDQTKQKIETAISKNKERNIILIDQENQGKAIALNNALKIAKGEFFACLDADSYVDRETLVKMLAVYERETEDLAIVTPAMKVNTPKTRLQKFQRVEYMISMFMGRLMSHLNCIYVAPGPFSVYRTKIIKDIGGFDKESLTEDQEIAYRVQKNHYKIKHCYNAYVYTATPPTLKKLFKQRNRWYKGGIFNLIKYKDLVFNKNYGDFGVIQMTSNISIFILGAITISAFSYYTIWPLLKMIYRFYLVNFNILPYFKNIQFTGIWLDVNVPLLMVLSLIFAISLAVLLISHKNAREKVGARNIPNLVLYILVYYLILCVIEFIVFFEVATRRKKQKW